jgi:2-polyprenyl-3-methyl-5-hydroxy-6-metoxy-1,4-benzoquinol methylase
MEACVKPCVVNPNHNVDRPLFRKQGAEIALCRDCGCIMADIPFNHEQYESAGYYTLARKTIDSIDNEWGFRWRYVLGQIRKSGDFSSLLDVGAGNGYFVSLAAKEFGLDATGIEISNEEIRFAREVIGVQLVNEDIAQHRSSYDVVTCFNVLEHVPDPRAFLSAAISRVRPGGILVLTTPNTGCVHARVKGLRDWNMVDPPHHINLFSRKALGEMLAAKEMQVIRYETLSTYINFVRKFDTKSLVFRRLFFHTLRLANMGADHFVIARRIPAEARSSRASTHS